MYSPHTQLDNWVLKVAVTLRACVMLTVHRPVPLHPSPLQPVKREPLSGVAVSVTLVPWSKAALHVLPQLIPTGLLVTVPLPVPALLTVRVNGNVSVMCTDASTAWPSCSSRACPSPLTAIIPQESR